MIFMETKRLLFRSHEAGDEADFVSMHTDAEVRRYVGGQAWPVGKARARFREQYLGKPTETYGLWATVFKEEGKYIGSCGLRAPGSGMGASLAHYLARAYWGRGLATEGARALIGSAFGRLHLDRVVATMMADNAGSWRVAEKCGMRRVRTFHYPGADLMPGAEHGDFVYELARDDWSRQEERKPPGHAES